MSSIIPKLTEDVLELYGDCVIRTDGLERLQYYQEFETWYDGSGFDEISSGRLYNYCEITEYLTILTVAHEKLDVSEDAKYSRVPGSNPLRDWTSDDWRGMRETLIAIRKDMLKMDANATLDDVVAMQEDDGGKGKDQIDRELSKEKYFDESFLELLKRFSLHERLAPFRRTLEDGGATVQSTSIKRKRCIKTNRVEDGPSEDPVEFLEDFLDVMESDEDKQVQLAFAYLLEKDRKSFKPVDKLQEIFSDRTRPYSFDRLIERTNKLIRKWADLVFDAPTLAGHYIHDEDKRKESKALERLHRSRARLDESVKDPLPDVVAAAARAKRPAASSANDKDSDEDNADEPGPIETKKRRSSRSRDGGRLIEQKKSAVQLVFSQGESDDEEIEEAGDDDDDEVLPGTTNRTLQVTTNLPPASPRKKAKSQQKPYDGKRAWTNDERNAIKEGIKICGKGNWAAIKERFSHILAERTSGQIKDCARTMKRQGELNDLLGDDQENSDAEEEQVEAGVSDE